MNGENLYVTAVKVAGGKIVLEFIDLDNHRPYSTEEKNVPHPDLYNALKRLKIYLAQVYHYKTTELIDKIDINGFSNKNESTYCVIKGTLTVPSGKKVAINSDAIDMEKEIYGFEQDLEEVINDIRKEAEEFFFKGKTAQQTIPFKEQAKPDTESMDFDAEVEAESAAQDLMPEEESVHDGKMAAAEPDKIPGDDPGSEGDIGEPGEDIPPPEPTEQGVPGL